MARLLTSTLTGGSRLFLSTLAPAPGTDTVPNPFFFTDQADVLPSTLVLSNTITIIGIDAPATVTVSGGAYSKNGGAFTTNAGTVVSGDTVTLRTTSPAEPLTSIAVTLDVGGITDVWTVTTQRLAATPDVSIQLWVDDLIVEVPEPSEPTIERAVRYAITEFFRESEAWRQTGTFPVLQGVDSYSVSLPQNTYILAADYAYYLAPNSTERRQLDSVLPERVNFELTGQTREYYTTRSQLVVNPSDEAGDIEFGIIIQPTHNISQIPEALATSWFEAIRAGALYRLLAMPGKPWSDKGTAKYYQDVFYAGIATAKREARKDRSRPKRTVRFNTGFAW